jgi:hypothetical protein
MKKRIGILLSAILLITPVNVSAAYYTLQDALETANARREGIVKPGHDRLAELTEGRVPTMESIHMFWPGQGSPAFTVTVEDAVADVNDFFDLLRDVYGGYTYFGGDEVFNPIRGEIIGFISARESSVINSQILGQVIRERLAPVITDNHFSISGRHFSPRASSFMSSGVMFFRDENGFKNAGGLYIESIAEYEAEDIMRLHIGAEGGFYYSPVLLLNNAGQSVTVDITYRDGSEQSVVLRRTTSANRRMQGPSLQYIEDIPVVTVIRMGVDSWGEQSLRFLSFAEELKDEPVVIVDVRGNGGGMSTLSQKWMYLLTGEIVPGNNVLLRAWDYEAFMVTIENENRESPFYIPYEDFIKLSSPEPFGGRGVHRYGV